MSNYEEKYLKYKSKYLNLKNQLNQQGGSLFNKSKKTGKKFDLFEDESPVYVGSRDNNELLKSKEIIADSDKVKKILEKEGDNRKEKIYKISFSMGNYIDDLDYMDNNGKYYASRSFQPERLNDRTILLGWKNYSKPEMDQKTKQGNQNKNRNKSQTLFTGTKIYGKDGKYWGKLGSRMKNNKGWILITENIVYDDTYEKTWKT